MTRRIVVLMSIAAAALLLSACSKPDRPTVAADGPADAPAVAAQEPAAEVPGAADSSSDELVEYLFVQHADKASLENNVLTLEGIPSDVLYFSDRPERIVGRESLEAFISSWDEGEINFSMIPPNAIVTVVRGGESFDLAVILTEPMMVSDASMTYNVEILDGPDSGVGENVAVFIDGLGGKPGLETRLGRPGKPGDPGGLRNGAEANRANGVNVSNVKDKRGREGARKFQHSGSAVDRKI